MGFWKAIGHGFAAVGKGAATAALWASKHPEVIAQVASISNPATAILTGVQIVGEVADHK